MTEKSENNVVPEGTVKLETPVEKNKERRFSSQDQETIEVSDDRTFAVLPKEKALKNINRLNLKSYECAGCGRKLEAKDVSIVGPFTLTWCNCVKCKNESRRIAAQVVAKRITAKSKKLIVKKLVEGGFSLLDIEKVLGYRDATMVKHYG